MNKEEATRLLPRVKLAYGTANFTRDSYTAHEWFETVEKALKQEPKTGHWIGIDEEPHEVWECDRCGFVIDGSGCIDPYDYRDTYKFCPNCGARMVET